LPPQPKPPALYGLSLPGGVLVGGRSLKIDILGIKHKGTELGLIQERGSIMAQGFNEGKCSLRKNLEIKVQDPGF